MTMIDFEKFQEIFLFFDWDQVVDGEIYDYWRCCDCGEFYTDCDSDGHTVEGKLICDDCCNENYQYCRHCVELHHTDDMYYIPSMDYLVCDACLDNYTRCDRCGEYCRDSDVICDGHNAYCQTCFDDYYYRCDGCGNIFHYDDVCSTDCGTYCEDCYSSHNDCTNNYGIYEYNYVPELCFKGDGTLYFGVELEIDYGKIDKFRFSELSKTFYCKHDGSLDYGFEIVSHPMTYDWIMENTPFTNPITLAKEAGFKSHNTSTCGLHVHMSRKAFGEGATQDDRITSFIYFFEKFWKEIVTFSRRTSQHSIDQYCKRFLNENEFDEVPNPLPMKVVDETKKKLRYERYMCVNITNRNTVEVRIFRGTLKENTLLASIQLCKLFYELSVFDVGVIENMSWSEIKKYAETDYPELIKAFEERNL